MLSVDKVCVNCVPGPAPGAALAFACAGLFINCWLLTASALRFLSGICVDDGGGASGITPPAKNDCVLLAFAASNVRRCAASSLEVVAIMLEGGRCRAQATMVCAFSTACMSQDAPLEGSYELLFEGEAVVEGGS